MKTCPHIAKNQEKTFFGLNVQCLYNSHVFFVMDPELILSSASVNHSLIEVCPFKTLFHFPDGSFCIAKPLTCSESRSISMRIS